MFKALNYKKWCFENKIDQLFGIDLKDYGRINKKIQKSIYETVDPNNFTPFPPELDDLIRLHYLVRTRKVTTVLEFGVGKSTLIFADAIQKNEQDYQDFVTANLRRSNPFEVHAIDNSAEWIEQCRRDISKKYLGYLNFHFSPVEMTTFNGRACTMYENLPNICPDLIYIDAPDQFNVEGSVRGISTAHPDRLPMLADVLMLEPFLLPGTLIVIDGRTANARFLQNNFQRNWKYNHFQKEDIHIFELIESPFGKINEAQLRFCLGNDWVGL